MPTGNNIKIDTAKIKSVADVVSAQMNIIKSSFDSIRKDALELRGSFWEGASADAYYDNMKKLCYEQPLSGTITAGYVVNVLEGYVQSLNKTAKEFDTTEHRLEGVSEALPSNIFGI